MGYERGGPLIVTPLAAVHLRAIEPQPQQLIVKQYIAQMGVEHWLTPDSWCAFHGTDIVAVGGVMPIWEGRGYAWSILSVSAGLHFLRLHRVVRNLIEGTSHRRIEAHVDLDFAAGHRWIRLLGFHIESVQYKYNPDGTDAVAYVRFR